MRHSLRSGSTSCTAMTRVAAALVCVALVGLPCGARAQHSVVLVHEGHEGVWLPFKMAAKLQADAELVPVLQEQITKLHERTGRTDLRLVNLQDAIDASTQSEKAAIDSLLEAERLMREAQQDRDSWQRSPWLWAGVGSGVTVVVMVLAVRMLNASRR